MSTKSAPGRVDTLTADQERVLKDVWTYLLHFWGYEIQPTRLRSQSIKLSKVVSNNSTKSSNKKSGGFLSKFKKSSSNKKKTAEETDKENKLNDHSAYDPNVSLTTDLKIHHALKALDRDTTRKALFKFLRQDTPDNLLLRFVRARKWDVDKSLVMLSNTLQWRTKETQVDALLLKNELGMKLEDKKGVMKQFELGKAVVRGIDKKGRPIVIIKPRLHHSSDQTEEEVELYTLLVIEYARLFLIEPVDSCSILFDMSGFTMANMDYTPVKYIIGAFEAHYPESLGVLFIHKAPWIFSGIWNIIKNWLDPVVASKIIFTKTIDELEKVIELKHIPKDLGGEDEYEWEYLEPSEELSSVPIKDSEKLSEVEKERNELIDQFLELTIKWIESNNETDSRELLNQRIELGKKLGENYTKLDPMTRNRACYDRLGQWEHLNNY
ncbi:hypothetical protein BVG19_g2780 [[Candida] boidinii]|nr:hypothetical protein BVG19_g2780 [[Candida] boidinii]OWB52849.1 hypothetical protein B5S27_g4432 [[Candida] boidinii]OWB67601.1 hypothetical protein B5S30_g2963 [[Candida] boidinii]